MFARQGGGGGEEDLLVEGLGDEIRCCFVFFS